jgi:hypothetical protein
LKYGIIPTPIKNAVPKKIPIADSMRQINTLRDVPDTKTEVIIPRSNRVKRTIDKPSTSTLDILKKNESDIKMFSDEDEDLVGWSQRLPSSADVEPLAKFS